jgi:membrane protease YdiL (CAAX protease family)
MIAVVSRRLRSVILTPRFVSTAALFYGGLIVVATLWNFLRGREFHFLGDSVTFGIALGLSSAVMTVSLGILLYRVSRVVREVSDELAPMLVDGGSLRDLLLISLFSGVGEELLFRGAVQPEFGLVVAAILFGALHIGPDRRYLFWTVWAMLAGLLFGGLYVVTGGLLAPVIAHVFHNAATFALWRRSRRSKVAAA